MGSTPDVSVFLVAGVRVTLWLVSTCWHEEERCRERDLFLSTLAIVWLIMAALVWTGTTLDRCEDLKLRQDAAEETAMRPSLLTSLAVAVVSVFFGSFLVLDGCLLSRAYVDLLLLRELFSPEARLAVCTSAFTSVRLPDLGREPDWERLRPRVAPSKLLY